MGAPVPKLEAWFPLPHDCIGSISEQRRRNGIKPPPRFIVLGPMPADRSKLRPMRCAGNYVGGRAVLDAGVIDESMRIELEKECALALSRALMP